MAGTILLCVLLALLLYLSTGEVITLFKVTAETERVELTTAPGTSPVRLVGASVEDDLRALSEFTGTLQLRDNVRVVLTRVMDDSAVTIVAEPQADTGSVGTLQRGDSPPVELRGDVGITLPLGSGSGGVRRMSLHIAARDVQIGARWRPEHAGVIPPLLRAGRVSLIGLAQGDVPFEAQSFELGPYEVVTDAPRSRAGTGPIWWGVLSAEPGASAVHSTFAVMDTRIALQRGTESYALGVTVFDHLRGHPRFALFCAAILMIVQIVAALTINSLQNTIDARANVDYWRT